MPLADLSKQAVGRAVVGAAVQHPSVVYPAALGLLGALGGAVLAAPLGFVAAAAGGGLAVLGLGVNLLLRRDALAQDYLQRAQQHVHAQREAMLKDLDGDLRRAGAQEALAQFARLQEKMRAFEILLGERLRPGELTHGRFLGIAEQVFLAGLENLRTAGLLQEARDAIDTGYIRQRIQALQQRDAPSAAQAGELQGLQRQLALHAEQEARIEACLAENEQALAELGRCSVAVAQMKTGETASVGMEAAMAELARVAQRARDYA
jgi:hypothetical protein